MGGPPPGGAGAASYKSNAIYHPNHHIYHYLADPYWHWEDPLQLKWFFPSVGDQMLSEITVAKGSKLALLHCVKSESDKNGKKYNQIHANQMVALINGFSF